MKARGNKLDRGFGLFFGVWTDQGYRPPLIHRLLKPKKITGNQVNGLKEKQFRRPVRVYHAPDRKIAYRAVNLSFILKGLLRLQGQVSIGGLVRKWQSLKLDDVAGEASATPDAEAFTQRMKDKAIELGAYEARATLMRQEWTYQGTVTKEKWVIMLAVPMDYQELSKAPFQDAADEVIRTYDKAHMVAHHLSNWIRGEGWPAHGHGSFQISDVLMIPAAIAAGIGELGKHGSLIHRKLGSSFRLAFVLTDAPLISEKPHEFGAEEFCRSCQICANACPPNAIIHQKQLVRGMEKYYVDFDKCVPFFNDTGGCAICIAVCPWSRPGVADNLVLKMARKRDARIAGPGKG